MASNEIRINQSTIDVNPLGISKLLGFKGRFSIPFSHIKVYQEIMVSLMMVEVGELQELAF